MPVKATIFVLTFNAMEIDKFVIFIRVVIIYIYHFRIFNTFNACTTHIITNNLSIQ